MAGMCVQKCTVVGAPGEYNTPTCWGSQCKVEKEDAVDKYLEAVHRLATDEVFRTRFASDAPSALEEVGTELPQDQISALKEMVALSYGRVDPNSWGGGGWGRFSYAELSHSASGTR